MLTGLQVLAILFFGGNCIYCLSRAFTAESYMKSDCVASAVFYGLLAAVFVIFFGHAV